MSRYASQSLIATTLVCSFLLVGCGGERSEFVNIGTAPQAGAFYPIGTAIARGLNENTPEGRNWKVQANETQGSQENIRMLDRGELDLAISNSSISYFAARGTQGWDKEYDIRAIMTLAPNVAMFITQEGSGINAISDLRGKNVVVGPPGAGFEQFVGPILEAHGVTMNDITPQYLGQGPAVDALTNGTADAAFLGGAVPTDSITRACTTLDVQFVPFGQNEREDLVEAYDCFEHYTPDLTSDIYEDIKTPFKALNVGSAHVITSANADEDLIYQITKTIYENMSEIKKGHGSFNVLNDAIMTRNTGIAFHPGAVKYYKEAGIWPEGTD